MRRTLVCKVNVEIFMTPQFNRSELTAAIQPVYNEKGELDSGAYSEYTEFVTNVYAALSYNGYEVVEDHPSDKSITSYYFTAYKKSKDPDDKNIKCILFIRVSDHESRPESHKATHMYYNAKAQELKSPPDKTIQKWKLKDIVVNNTRFLSYDDALDHIDHILATMSN